MLGTGLAGRCEGVEAIELPDDRMGEGAFDGRDGAERPEALHYAPLGHEGVRARVARIAAWIAEARPALMVVDVSVEVAMLARLASTPSVYVRLSGRRFDRPHLEAYRGARGLLAPFHSDLDDDRTPEAIRRMTFYAPGLLDAPAARPVQDDLVEDDLVQDDLVLGVVGEGGGLDDGEAWAAAARALPQMRWRVIGRCTAPADPPANLEVLGWVDDAVDRVASAAVVVGAAGDGLVSAVAAAGRPYVCLPQPRPFAEQHSKAARLAALGAAVVCDRWPSAAAWPGVLDRARRLDASVLARLTATDGAQRAADWLAGVAAQAEGPSP